MIQLAFVLVKEKVMYKLNFSSGPNLPSQIPLINEYLLANFSPSTNPSEEKKKTAYNRTLVAAGLGLAMITLAGAVWAYNNPDLLKKWLEKTKFDSLGTNSSSTAPESTPATTSSLPESDSLEMTPSENSFWICDSFQNGKSSCFDILKLSKLDAGDLFLPITFLLSLSPYYSTSSFSNLDQLSSQISSYILQLIQPKNSDLIPTLPSGLQTELSPSNFTGAETPISSLIPIGDPKTSSNPLSTKILENLRTQGVNLEYKDSKLWAITHSPNGQKTFVDLSSLLYSNMANSLSSQELSSLGLIPASIPGQMETSDRVNQLIASRFSRLSKSKIDSPTQATTSSPPTIEDSKLTARDRALNSIISNIQSGRISIEFQAILSEWVWTKGGLVDMVKEVIKELRDGKTANAVTYSADRLVTPFKTSQHWFDILNGWYKNKREEHMSKSLQEGSKSPYEAYPELTREDEPILRQAIYKKIQGSLERSALTMSPAAREELSLYIKAFQKSQL